MKKFISIVLCVITLILATGCNYAVPQAMQYPDYTFETTPDTQQLRQTAVRAMRDALSIQWCPKKDHNYRKNGATSYKDFSLKAGTTYGGLLYTSAYSGIFQFFEYYNTENGCLEYDGTDDELKVQLGSSCADTLLWAWSTVCNSIEGGYYPVLMVPKNGYCIVGDYEIRAGISSYNEMPTYDIINNHDKEVILDAYAKMLPADALVSTPAIHAMMVIEEPVVVYNKNGKINPKKSYVLIQDQRGLDQTSLKEVVDGVEISYFGRLSAKFTFEELYEKKYIPVTAAEFIGQKPYEQATVTVNNPECNTVDALKDIVVESNYPLAVVNIIGLDKNGKTITECKELFGAASMYGVPRSFNLLEIEGFKNLSKGNIRTIKVEVVVSTGERFYPIEFTV